MGCGEQVGLQVNSLLQKPASPGRSPVLSPLREGGGGGLVLGLITSLSLEDGSVRPTVGSVPPHPGGWQGRPAAPDPSPCLRLFLGPPRALGSSLRALSQGLLLRPSPAAAPQLLPAQVLWRAPSVRVCPQEKSRLFLPVASLSRRLPEHLLGPSHTRPFSQAHRPRLVGSSHPVPQWFLEPQ